MESCYGLFQASFSVTPYHSNYLILSYNLVFFDDYTVSLTYKTQIFQRINKQWREFKSKLRSKHYDKCDTDLERIRNCPGGVPHKDWVIFVGNQSTPNAQARHSKGKSAREALKTPHTYGRRGAARTNKAMAERSVSLSHQKQSASPKVSRPSAARSEDLGSKHILVPLNKRRWFILMIIGNPWEKVQCPSPATLVR